MTIVFLLSACTLMPAIHEQYQQTVYAECAEKTDYVYKKGVGPLKVFNLNIAHGRKEALNQMLVSEESIRRNLHEIGRLLKRSSADIVALQEADGPSRWSGGFDHVAELAQQGDYAWYCRAGQARSWMFEFGTALLSKNEMTEVISHSFSPTPPTLTKGFILGQISWYPNQESAKPVPVDIVSIHLDFSRHKVRQQQLIDLLQVLAARKNPVIVLGDLNSDWFDEESIVRQLVQQADLQAYRPAANDLGTYRKNDRRLDWILISKELTFKNYSVLPDSVSDHYAIMAEIILNADLSKSN